MINYHITGRNQDGIVSSLMKSSFLSKKLKKSHFLEMRRKINPMLLVNQSNIGGFSIKIQMKSFFLKRAFPWKESCKATLFISFLLYVFFCRECSHLYY